MARVRSCTVNRADEAAWREYVAVEIAKFYDHCDGVTYVWQSTPAAERVIAKLGGDSVQAAFRGPWHVIRKHLTGEFRQWVEEYEGTERLTPSEWRAAQIAARAEVAWMDSADYALGQLAELRRLTAERDALIVQAAKRGAAKTAIAREIGLSRQQIHTIVAAAEVAEVAPVTPIRPVVAADEGDTEWVQTADGQWHEVF